MNSYIGVKRIECRTNNIIIMRTSNKNQSEFIEVPNASIGMLVIIVGFIWIICYGINTKIETQRRIEAQNALNERMNEMIANNADDINLPKYR